MTNNIAVSDLSELAVRINQEHDLCEQSLRAGLQHAVNAGGLLIQAKALCQHGQWGDWLKDNCTMSERTAQAYMRVARNLPLLESKAQRVADLSFREAVNLLKEPLPDNKLSNDERAQLERCEAVIGAGLPEAKKVLDALENLRAHSR